jgi:hypothetical protein
MQNPLFHLVTTEGKAAAYTIPAPARRSLAAFWDEAGRTLENREQLGGWVRDGFQPFPKRHKMEPTGAERGEVENIARSMGYDKVYDFYQMLHDFLADNVNRIQMSFAQMRLEQLVKQSAQRGEQMTPERLRTYRVTAAQESNPIGGNLPREELNRALYRGLGSALFSRGLQVSTVRMLTRTVESNEIVRAMAKRNGFSDAEATKLVKNNSKFLMAGLALDYALMQVLANVVNYTASSLENSPDKEGKRGGHFAWQNPGATNHDILFPNRVFIYAKKDKDGQPTGEEVYMSNPIRTVRDIIEYAMIPFQIGGGTKPQVLYNKFSPLANLVKGRLSGEDWAGRPLTGPGDVMAEVASQGMPAPFGDLPRYAVEAYRSGNTSFLAEGVKKMLAPENAIPVLLGLQPRVSSKDPTVTQEAIAQSADEKKLWARVSRVKAMVKDMAPEARERQIEHVLDEARSLHVPGNRVQQIARVLRSEGVSQAQRKAAGRYESRQQTDQIEPPPEM